MAGRLERSPQEHIGRFCRVHHLIALITYSAIALRCVEIAMLSIQLEAGHLAIKLATIVVVIDRSLELSQKSVLVGGFA